MSEDQFTSIQWDREEEGISNLHPPPQYTPIHEEDEESGEGGHAKGTGSDTEDDPSNSLLLDRDDATPVVDDLSKRVPQPGHSDDVSHATGTVTGTVTGTGAGAAGIGGDVSGNVGCTSGEVSGIDFDSSAISHGRNDAESSSINSISSKKNVDEANGNAHLGHVQRGAGAVDADVDEDVPYSIQTSVTEPQREMDSASKPYISYLLTTVTDSKSIARLSSKEVGEDNIIVSIRRRYGDFKFLYDCLCNDYPQYLIPPLPSKLNFKYLTGDTFLTEFVHKRLNSLNRFVRFISQHKSLSQLKIFHLFVSDSSDWSTFQKNLKISNGIVEEDNPFPLNKVVNEDLLTETIMNFLTPSKHKRESNKDILEISDKLKKLYENLIKLDRIFAKLNKKNYDLSFDYEQFLNQITKLSQTTPGTDSDEGVVTNNFKVFANSLLYFSENWSNLHKYIDESFLVTLKDCAKYIVSLTNLIELQHNKKIDLQVLQDYLAKAKVELSNLGGAGAGASGNHHVPAPNPVLGAGSSGGIVNNTTQLIKDTLSTGSSGSIGSSHTESKRLKLAAKIEQLENEISSQNTIVNNLTNRIIHEEYPNWDKFNKLELKNSLLGLCDEQILFYSGLVDKWSEAELKLINRLKELS